jgi:hypothetical protein
MSRSSLADHHIDSVRGADRPGLRSAVTAVKAGLTALASRALARIGSPGGSEPPEPCLDPYQIALAGLGSPLLSYGEWW